MDCIVSAKSKVLFQVSSFDPCLKTYRIKKCEECYHTDECNQ